MSEMLDEIYEEAEGEELQDVAVFDDASAQYLLRRIAEADEQFERMEAWYKHQTAKAKAVRDRTVEWAERNLRAYFDLVPKKTTKTQQSYELPGGKLVLKQKQPKYERDDAALVPWLEGNGRAEMVKVEKSANWAELKKTLTLGPDGESMITEDGEVVPGVKAVPQLPEFSVTVNTKKQ